MKHSTQQSCLGKGFLVITGILFVLITSISLTSFNVQKVAFAPDTLKEHFEEDLVDSGQFSRSIEKYLVNWSEDSTSEGSPASLKLFSILPPAERAAIVESLFPTDFQTSLVSSTIDGYYRWLTNDDLALLLTYNMSPFKANLTGDQGQQAVTTALGTLTECTEEEINPILSQGSNGVINPGQFCRLPEPWRAQQQAFFEAGLLTIAYETPEIYEENALINIAPATLRNLSLVRWGLNLAQNFNPWGWILPAMLFIILAAVGVRCLESAGVWLGLPLIGSGTLVLALAVLGRVSFLFSAGLQRTLLNNPATADFAHAVLLSLSGRILQPMLWQGVALLAIGVIPFLILLLRKTSQSLSE
jgi:hypothetical protein